jgi:tRNA nucleotidyltransferase (CCA-adding enzyme)
LTLTLTVVYIRTMTNNERYYKARAICQVIKSAGGHAYLVGGFVRDRLLKIESKDIDIEVFGLQPDIVENLFSGQKWNFKLVGKSFGCYHSEDGIDLAMPRTELVGCDPVSNAHTNFTCEIDPFLSVLTAAKRRDLTINAIYYDPLQRKYKDPYNGLADLQDGIIRAVSPMAFVEDPLRVLRVAQFMARFNFTVDKKTEALCEQAIEYLPYLSKERVFGEITKLLMQADKPSIGFTWLYNIGALNIILPDIARLEHVHDLPPHHRENNVLEHTLMALDVLPINERSIDVMLGILFHDAGKGIVSYKHHSEVANEIPEILTDTLTNEADLIKSVQSLVLNHSFHCSVSYNDVTPKVLRRLSTKVDLTKLCKVMRADALGRIPPKTEIENYVRDIEEFLDSTESRIEPIILGRHLIGLGVEPGPKMGVLLKDVYNAQLNGEFTDEAGGLKYVWDTVRYELNVKEADDAK